MKSVFVINDYGKIHIHLKEMMERQNITRNQLSISTNTRFEVINKWYHDEVERLDLDVLARMCYVLDCSPSDIIKYEE